MNNILYIDIIKKVYESRNHPIDNININKIIPFYTTARKTIRDIGNNFRIIMGEFVRNICEIKLPKEKKSDTEIIFESDPIIENLISNIKYSPEYESDLKRLLRMFIYNEQDVNLFHPYMFTLLSTPDQNEYHEYAQFMSDIFIQDNHEMKKLFQSKESDHLLTTLVLKSLKVEELATRKRNYQSLLDTLTSKYQDDLKFISKHKEFFLKNFELLTHFYAFMYICQLFYKFERFEKGDFTQVSPLTFALDWEPMNKRRQATDSYKGFKRISRNYHKFFVHIHTLAQLSSNSICNPENNSEKKMRFYSYREIYDIFSDQPIEVRNRFIEDINNWILNYSEIFNITDTSLNNASSLEEAFRNLFNSIEQGVNHQAATRFGKRIEELAGTTFLKSRGIYGKVLNITHDMLILLTAVCVKNERIPLKVLFQRFEERGVNFDRHSKMEIVQLLDSNNIIDKKSDSGDAQYVKPIL